MKLSCLVILAVAFVALTNALDRKHDSKWLKRALYRLLSKRSAWDNSNKQVLLDWHNEYRAKVAKGEVPDQPQAADMIAIEWDDRLEQAGKIWADQCAEEFHDTAAGRRASVPALAAFPVVGQNMAAQQGPNFANNYEFFKGWEDESNDYSYEQNAAKEKDKVVGHYTALAWARTSLVGCSFAPCTGKEFNKLICDTALGGNWGPVHEDTPAPKPYKAGTPCSQCPQGFSFCMNDVLCARKRACDTSGGQCRCTIQGCVNGDFDSTNCYCNCRAGWTGPTCSEKCKDDIYFCDDYQRHCTVSSADYSKYFLWLSHDCKKTCNACKKPIEYMDQQYSNANGIKSRVNYGAIAKSIEETEKAGEKKPTYVGVKGCKDFNVEECPGWKGLGWCQSNKQFMEEYCKKTCGLCDLGGGGQRFGGKCENKYPACWSWASGGECKNNPSAMEVDCPYACGLCTPAKPEESCKDVDTTNCAGWAAAGVCSDPYMQSNCRKSCNLCGQRRRRRLSFREFHEGRARVAALVKRNKRWRN